MNKCKFLAASFVLFVLTACASAVTEPPTASPMATATSTATSIATPTETLTPSPTPTETPLPTETPMTELSPANVDLPVEIGISPLIYKFCYVFADDNNDGYLDRFHAGDMIYFYTNFTGIDNEVEYLVLAPIEGQVMYSQLINNRIGWEIRVRTPYVYEGEQVWYDIVHATEPVSGIHEGVYVQRGQPILIASTLHDNGRFEKAIDIGFRNGPRGANPDIQHSFSPYSYFSPSIFFEDDFQRMESASVSIIFEECLADPVPPGYPMNP